MNPRDFILPRVRAMHAYVPGLQLNDADVVKLNTNENPFGISDAVRRALQEAIDRSPLHRYPEPRSEELRREIARRNGLTADQVLIGNGSDEILSIVFRAFCDTGQSAVVAEPSYSLYPGLLQAVGARHIPVDLDHHWRANLPAMQESARQQAARLIILTNPNAPTGVELSRPEILNWAGSLPCPLLVDEAYSDFAQTNVRDRAGSRETPGLMVCGTFSKSHSLAGQRIGWLLAHADLIADLDKIRDSYNLSRLAQVAALAALRDDEEFRRRITIVKENRAYLTEQLTTRGFEVLPSGANFVFTKPPLDLGAADLRDFLQARKILVRHFASPQRCLPYVRISIGTRPELDKLLAVTDKWLGQ
ncbi:MAG: histidinol-phosphate transaminase [Spirochaetales bacterium]|nr:histidinol-phosphate transaminase [Leptospiraceae bacterium]MCP5479996.1 histidinol-phosphate transaminase [Spirochaetales bacterium]MCP5486975.1 histidinol-phosphate transaminase [Spirochaetales bacterium]